MVSQLTSRGTWRHLVPVWMTVTVEGRGLDGSATTDGSSRTEEAGSESWLYTLTGDGKGAIGGPMGENIVSVSRSCISLTKWEKYKVKSGNVLYFNYCQQIP